MDLKLTYEDYPKSLPKMRYVVPDDQVELWRAALGDTAEVIPQSETLRPADSANAGRET